MYPPILPFDLNSINLGDEFNADGGDAQSAYSFDTIVPGHFLTDVSHGSARIPIDSPAALRGMTATRHSPVIGPSESRQFCDARLQDLRMDFWTQIPIDEEFAACAMSFHFETYHAFLGFMDVELFIGDLVEHKLNHCSPFIVSALMSLACVRAVPS